MQKAYKNELLALQHTRFDKKKNFVSLETKPLKYDTQAFHKKNMQMMSIHLNKHSIDHVKHNYWNGTKLDNNIYW